MAAGRYDLRGRAGSDFTRVFYFKDPSGTLINLTGYTARASFRRGSKSTSLLNLSVGAGISLGGVAGSVTMTLTGAQMTTIQGVGIFGIELISAGGWIEDFIEGSFLILPDIVTT